MGLRTITRRAGRLLSNAPASRMNSKTDNDNNNNDDNDNDNNDNNDNNDYNDNDKNDNYDDSNARMNSKTVTSSK